MAVKPLNFGPFLRGVHAETDPYTQPKGSVPRASNQIMTDRGALTDCDGSGIINAVGGVAVPSMPERELFPKAARARIAEVLARGTRRG